MSSAEATLDTMKRKNHLHPSLPEPAFPSMWNPFHHEDCFEYYSYNWERSTEDNFRSNDLDFHGNFTSNRRHLDYEYHSHYCSSRQLLQDSIIEGLLFADNISADNASCDQWIIFSAGVMGAGKTHTINALISNEKESFLSEIRCPFVTVDQDEIRRMLPEFRIYVDKDPERAGVNTRKEAGMLAEILTEAALERGHNVLVDGTLKDAEWYMSYFRNLRFAYPWLKLGIIHVTAPVKDIHERVKVSKVKIGENSAVKQRTSTHNPIQPYVAPSKGNWPCCSHGCAVREHGASATIC